MKGAVLVIDMLNDFVKGELKCERAERIIPNLRRLIQAARERGVPVIYSNDAHLPVDHELKVWGPHAIKGTKGAEVIPELSPTDKDFVLEKRTYSGFFETGLDQLLRDLGVDTVIITGLHTNICDRHTAADAFFRGYKVVVASDGVEAFTQKDHEEGLEYMKMAYGAEVKTVAEIIKDFER
ncbi:MAG: nicotinamidase [Hadesarchaea archaeon YNP_N21]|jgi:nicotinamidase-related amidase|nr:MAG: nicotinamidase [Hadesarchaea archaeon YNP_N21]